MTNPTLNKTTTQPPCSANQNLLTLEGDTTREP